MTEETAIRWLIDLGLLLPLFAIYYFSVGDAFWSAHLFIESIGIILISIIIHKSVRYWIKRRSQKQAD